jgi:hypothetical protein
MKNIICKLFGHNYRYYLLKDVVYRNVGFCKRCGKAEHYKLITGASNKEWIQLVGRTKKGAKNFLKSIEQIENRYYRGENK